MLPLNNRLCWISTTCYVTSAMLLLDHRRRYLMTIGCATAVQQVTLSTYDQQVMVNFCHRLCYLWKTSYTTFGRLAVLPLGYNICCIQTIGHHTFGSQYTLHLERGYTSTEQHAISLLDNIIRYL